MIHDVVTGLVDQPPKTVVTPVARGEAQRVYCAEDSPLRLGDGTPLHLEWVIEDRDGELYRVRSELGGWLRRTPYHGELDEMKLVSPQKAGTILRFTCADTDSDDPLCASWRAGYNGSSLTTS